MITVVASVYGFRDETIRKFSISLFNVFINVFKVAASPWHDFLSSNIVVSSSFTKIELRVQALPLCAQVGGVGGIFIVHAGLPR